MTNAAGWGITDDMPISKSLHEVLSNPTLALAGDPNSMLAVHIMKMAESIYALERRVVELEQQQKQ